MPGAERIDFDSPDESRTPDKTRVDVVNLGDATAARSTFQPGWRWSECIKPVVGGESCQHRHIGIATEGRLAVRHDDGTEVEIGPGEPYSVQPGHDAWVVGDEQFVSYEFASEAAKTFAQPN